MANENMLVVAAVLIAAGMIIGAYLIAQGEYTPIETNPNVYVTTNPIEHSIAVSGTASKEVAPDLLQIQLSVQTEATNAKQSQEENADVSAELRSQLESVGVDEESIRSTGYRVEPRYKSEYVCENDDKYGCHYESTLIGYRTTHSFRLDIEDLDKGGEIIDAASEAGDNETFINYISFTLKDETSREIQKALLEEASEEATEKAESIAKGLDSSLGNLLSANEGYSYTPYAEPRYALSSYDMAEEAAPTILSPGEVEVSATVNVAYEIA